MAPITVFIAEDHTLVREGTRQLLERHADLQVVGEAERGDLAVELIRRLQPDVAMLDLRLPGLNGIDVTSRVVAGAATRVLILSAYDEEDYVLAALEAGASGYVLKTAPGREVAEAIRAVQRGETVVQPEVSRKLAQYWRRMARPAQGAQLSARELDVLELLTRGLSNKEIGARLGISLRTVEGHLSNVFGKLGVSSRTEAALHAVQHHLLAKRELSAP